MTDPLSTPRTASGNRLIFPVYQVDAFTDTPFAGNPAAVCYLMVPRGDDWMQQVAMEMNLSETAYFTPLEGNGRYTLRWFTPKAEVDLCGHATLASAHVIWQTELAGMEDELIFETRSGELKARKRGAWIELDFPAEKAEICEPEPGLLESLGVVPQFVGKNRMDFLIEVATVAELNAIQPQLHKLASVTNRGVIVTAKAENTEYDFISRFFAPAVGVDEDPVTGSAHCCLGPYWKAKLGKASLKGFQASERGGFVGMEVNGERVKLLGQAVTVMQGVITV